MKTRKDAKVPKIINYKLKGLNINWDELEDTNRRNAVFTMFDELLYINIFHKLPEDATVYNMQYLRRYKLIDFDGRIRPIVTKLALNIMQEMIDKGGHP